MKYGTGYDIFTSQEDSRFCWSIHFNQRLFSLHGNKTYASRDTAKVAARKALKIICLGSFIL